MSVVVIQEMGVLRSVDGGCRRAGSQHPSPSPTSLHKEGAQDWWEQCCFHRLGALDFILLPGLRHSSSLEKLSLSALLPPSPLHLLPQLENSRLLAESPAHPGNFMLMRYSVRWTPGTLISSASPNSELMGHNKNNRSVSSSSFFYGAHKFQGGKHPW